jgi:DNA polymerase III delta prime subunit
MDLYNIYRQRTLKEMYNTSSIISVGDSLIKNTLSGKMPGVPQFMIFHSEHGGVGKTTVGRIFAKDLNPDANAEEVEAIFTGQKNPFFYEINAGNYRKIDDVRALEARIQYQRDMVVPFNIMYMINEAHRLTPDAQEVFLQMTENLPDHIRIIFTTTELSTINEKLTSRAKLYKFTSLDRSDMRKLLVDIAGKANVTVLPEYITDQLYDLYGHSIRKCINELESFISTGKVTGLDSESVESPRFGEVMDLLIKQSSGGSVSWTKDIVPKLNVIVDQMSPEEARIKFNWCLYGILVSRVGVTKGNIDILMKISEELKIPGYLPPKIDLYGTMFRIYCHAREIGLSSARRAENNAANNSQ